MSKVPCLYQVVTSMGMVVFESISKSACELYIKRSGRSDQLTYWPIFFKEMSSE